MPTPLSIPTAADIDAAAIRLAPFVNRTPLLTSRSLDQEVGRRVLLKCENLQRSGAFKFRGAFYALQMLSDEERQRGVVAFSSGNHGQGMALAANLLQVPAIICMPDDAPLIKITATRRYGAEVVLYDRRKVQRAELARSIASERGMANIPPYDHPHVIAGAGTIALEMLADAPEIDTLMMPVGGGGLTSGCALAAHAINPRIRIVGVEPETADDTRQSLRAGERITIPVSDTVADGIRTPTPGELTFPIVQEHVTDVVTVSDDDIRDAVRFALFRLKIVVEPTGAVALAAVLKGHVPSGARTVGVVLSGGNMDPAVMAEIVQSQAV